MNKIIVFNPTELKDKNIPAYLNTELKKAYTNEKLSYITFIFNDLSKNLKDQNFNTLCSLPSSTILEE